MKRFLKKYLSLLLLIPIAFPATGNAKKLLNRTAVVVNDEIILESDIRDFQKKLKSKSFQELFGGLDPRMFKDRNSVVQLLVEEKLIDQHVKKLDLSANKEEIDAQIRVIMKRNGISRAQLNQRLKQLGTNLAEYRKGIKRQLERKNLLDREIKPDLKISDERLRHYYHRESGATGNKEFRIGHIFTKNGKGARARADKIWKEIKDGKISFNEAAAQFSDDTSTQNNAGDLGFFARNSLSKEFRPVVTKLGKSEISRPVKTRSGYHILRLSEIRQADFKNVDPGLKEQLRNKMYAEELEKRMMLWIERKKKEAYIRIIS